MFTAAVGKMGITELIVILLIVLVIFGPKQLPKLSKMFGKTVTSFKQGLDEGLTDDDEKPNVQEIQENASASATQTPVTPAAPAQENKTEGNETTN